MYVDKGDFEESEWHSIRKSEKEGFEQITRLFKETLKREIREWTHNFKWEYKHSKKIKKEQYEKGMNEWL